ncbi:hypothetical protein FB567DRAFT_527408 [Paraphoma chrysanthemicola]|uniref:Uncharacterized protein n=1 Tax=Paraphoma chrysanthemicola TaxID=798071 RepID=A0A8K0R443_9PLEO|nr:hypothetical protein FB567DRAFT_527408 [Paraphoma chrysanthemicola]
MSTQNWRVCLISWLHLHGMALVKREDNKAFVCVFEKDWDGIAIGHIRASKQAKQAGACTEDFYYCVCTILEKGLMHLSEF